MANIEPFKVLWSAIAMASKPISLDFLIISPGDAVASPEYLLCIWGSIIIFIKS